MGVPMLRHKWHVSYKTCLPRIDVVPKVFHMFVDGFLFVQLLYWRLEIIIVSSESHCTYYVEKNYHFNFNNIYIPNHIKCVGCFSILNASYFDNTGNSVRSNSSSSASYFILNFTWITTSVLRYTFCIFLLWIMKYQENVFRNNAFDDGV